LHRFASFAERVSDRLFTRDQRAGLLVGAPRDLAIARSGGSEVIALEAIIDPLVEPRRRYPTARVAPRNVAAIS